MTAANARRPRALRLLIVGCGDVGLRLLRALQPRIQAGRMQVRVLSSQPSRKTELRALGAVPLVGDLDDAASLRRLAGLADAVVHLAPPPSTGLMDPRTQALVRALARRRAPARLVYVSTTGVYGDARGAWLDETCGLRPQSDRARRRVDAETCLRDWARAQGVHCSILRAPGIYALDRVGGDPRERLQRGTPVLRAQEDVFTNHIHADDLARACWRALFLGGPLRPVNVVDEGSLRMGDYLDQVADHCGLPRPPRISWAEAQVQLSPMQLSFWAESRRLRAERMRDELRLVLRYPTVIDALKAHPPG